MKVRLKDGLPYVEVSLTYRGRQITFENVLLDTGSGGTIFSADRVLAIGLHLEPNDFIHRIRGIGGAEFVFTKPLDRLTLGPLSVTDFEIEVGAMDYGVDMDSIVGMDFMLNWRSTEPPMPSN